MGRNKIKIEKIECLIKRRATFQKRSCGLLKKAKELSVLCEADVALIIIPPAGKAQHFSTRPGIEQVIEQFNAIILEGNEVGMCSNDEQCKGGCCGANISSGVLGAHGNIQMQQPPVFQTTQGREQVPIQVVPFVEMEDPCPTHVSVPWHFSNQQRIKPMLQQCNENVLYTPEEPMLKVQVPGTNPSTSDCMQGCEMQLSGGAQVWEAPQVIEQAHMQRTPFVVHPSEVSGPDRASDYMQGPQVGLCEMQYFSVVQPYSSMSKMPNGEAGKLQQLSSMSRTEKMVQLFNLNMNHNMSEEEITMHASHQTLQQLQEDETGLCSDEDLASFKEFANLLDSEDPSLSLHQIENKSLHTNPSSGVQVLHQQYLVNGQVHRTPGTNSSSSMQSAHWNMPMQQLQVFQGIQGREQVDMQGVPSVEMEHPSLTQLSVPGQFPHGASDYNLNQTSDDYEMPCYSDIHLPSSVWEQP